MKSKSAETSLLIRLLKRSFSWMMFTKISSFYTWDYLVICVGYAFSQIFDIKGLIKQLKNPFQPMWHSSGLSSREWESKSRQDNTKNEIAFHFGYKDKSEIFCSIVLHSCVFAYRKEEKKSKKKIILCLQKSCVKMQVLELSFSNSSNNCSHQVRRRNASIPKTILCC